MPKGYGWVAAEVPFLRAHGGTDRHSHGMRRRMSKSEGDRGAAPQWGGSSGPRFAALAVADLAAAGFTSSADITRYRPDDPLTGYSVVIDVTDGPSVMFEVVDWLWDARILDPDGEEVTVDEALSYLRARASGQSPKVAFRSLLERR